MNQYIQFYLHLVFGIGKLKLRKLIYIVQTVGVPVSLSSRRSFLRYSELALHC